MDVEFGSHSIKAINQATVHKICSGQVVLSLSTAVKELVENSIDAGASIIDVRLKQYGKEVVEVIDNGHGVKESDFESLTLKHHTSKIQDFSDVSSVQTFGFRGEALSSLCALCNVEIVTCHNEADVGTRLTFDNNGNIAHKSRIPRQVGTTVSLKNLFVTLPVRYKEFHKNVNREFSKMVNLLNAYCIISQNKRITCTNVSEKGRQTTILATNCSSSIKENLISVFGNKQVDSLMKFIQVPVSKELLEEFFLSSSDAEKAKIFQFDGYVSPSTHGTGRSAADRQYFFINGRPCDLPKVSKIVNQVYHSFNKHQFPFIFLNITLLEGSADVNVTPDKRQIFIPEEKVLLALIKSSLLKMYENQPSQVFSSVLTFKSVTEPADTYKKEGLSGLKRCLSDNNISPLFSSFKNKRLDSNGQKHSTSISTHHSNSEESPDSSQTFCDTFDLHTSSSSQDKISPSLENSINNHHSTHVTHISTPLPSGEDESVTEVKPAANGCGKTLGDIVKSGKWKDLTKTCTFISDKVKLNTSVAKETDSVCMEQKNGSTEDEVAVTPIVNEVSNNENSSVLKETCLESFDVPISKTKKYVRCSFSMDVLRQRLKISVANHKTSTGANYLHFRSKISPNENEKAEEELKKEISKDMFSKMKIIGQFNLGFIITLLNNDLFIVDQHATDEKYHFEIFQQDCVLETQKLIVPLKLELTVASEAVLLDNLSIFEKNGFKFLINDDSLPGGGIHLVSVPVCYNWSFGKEDVDELIFMLTDNPVQMVRPSRVNQMFASRACRKSVMIGTALSMQAMRKLIMHMGEIEQPWNCPHGRPTLRHLLNLSLLHSD